MKLFKNRITQEDEKTIRKMKSLFVDMNTDKQMTPNTPYGLFALSIQPNIYVDSIELEKNFKSILSHFYRWRYGSKWRKLKNLQYYFKGVIEKQGSGLNHIHITIFQPNMEELSLFVSYILKMMKSFYHFASHRIKKIYDIDGWENYISPKKSNKDGYVSRKRIEPPTYISSLLFSPIAKPHN
ncbi:MAG: hypothetical protein SO314_02430 [Alphaproteobacteria bacterium]|nr:hypothetical protein [Alphaproteobacteria bacterium]